MIKIKESLIDQYFASLDMLANCIEVCPEDVWLSGTNPRETWKIAAHAAFITHMYMGQTLESYQPWNDGPDEYRSFWQLQDDMEPFDFPDSVKPMSRSVVLDYVTYVRSLVRATVTGLDLETSESGFYWYKKIGKLSHQILNIRHVHSHIGQLSEILMANGIETKWISVGTD